MIEGLNILYLIDFFIFCFSVYSVVCAVQTTVCIFGIHN